MSASPPASLTDRVARKWILDLRQQSLTEPARRPRETSGDRLAGTSKNRHGSRPRRAGDTDRLPTRITCEKTDVGVTPQAELGACAPEAGRPKSIRFGPRNACCSGGRMRRVGSAVDR
jgi:hypothetical protein